MLSINTRTLENTKACLHKVDSGKLLFSRANLADKSPRCAIARK